MIADLKCLACIFLMSFATSCASPETQRGYGEEVFSLNDHTTIGDFAWSPDGKKLGISNFDPASGFSKTLILDLQTRNVSEPLAQTAPHAGFDAWTPNGDIVFATESRDLYLFSLASNQKVFFRRGLHSAWSMDGKWIAIQDLRLGIVLRDAETATESVLYGRDSDTDFYEVTWSPDSHLLAFSVSSRSTHKAKVVIIDLKGNIVSELIRPARVFSPSWARDGKTLAYLSLADGPYASFAFTDLKKDCGTLEPNGAWGVAWSPDGDYLAYATNQAIYLIPRDRLPPSSLCQ